MNEFDMEAFEGSSVPPLPKKSIVLTVTLELKDAADAVATLQTVSDAAEGAEAAVIGFNLFDSYRSLF